MNCPGHRLSIRLRTWIHARSDGGSGLGHPLVLRPDGRVGWVAVDLGAAQTFSGVRLNFENAFARKFAVEVSDDGNSWREVAAGEGRVGTVAVSFEPVLPVTFEFS